MSLPPASKAPCTFFLPSSFACRERVNRPRRRTHHQLRLHRDMCVKRGPQPIWMEANGEQKKINRRRRRRGEMLQCKNVSLWTFSFFSISFGHFSAVCGFQALVFFSLLLVERKTMKLTHWREMEFLNMTQKLSWWRARCWWWWWWNEIGFGIENFRRVWVCFHFLKSFLRTRIQNKIVFVSKPNETPTNNSIRFPPSDSSGFGRNVRSQASR